MVSVGFRLIKRQQQDDEKISMIGVNMRHQRINKTVWSGFTLVEILVVVVIIAIAAAAAIPLISSAGTIQLQSAANMVAADIEYAKSKAIATGQKFSVLFDADADTYAVQDQGGDTISHPVKIGFDYAMDFAGSSKFDRVSIADVDFDTGSVIKFDYLGIPLNSSNATLGSDGIVTLQVGDRTMYIHVEPATGYVSITE